MPRMRSRCSHAAVLFTIVAAACGKESGPSGDGPLALTALRGDSTRLAVADADGRGLRLLDGFGNEVTPAWSPDGTRLAFVRYYADRDDSDLFIRDMRTGAVTRLTSTSGVGEYDPTWSSDGRRIAFTRFINGPGSIWTIAADGTDEEGIVLGANPAWARDGRIAFTFPAQSGFAAVWVIPAPGTSPVQVSPDDGRTYRAPAWAPDGRLAYVRVDVCCGDLQHSALLVAAPDLANPREIVADSASLSAPSWSPDGGRIVYTRERQDDLALWVVDADGGHRHRITRARRAGEAPYGNASASWRPSP
jgi:TolB protein